MDKKHELMDKVCKQFGSLQNPNPPMPVDWMGTVAWHLFFERDDWTRGNLCLVYLHVENRIGIADYGVKGYTPTPCAIGDGVDGQKAVDWFNVNILDLTLEESIRIVFSTMR